jgi:hypothetical protein
MIGIAFDTHAAANRFKRAGFTEDQVEALVEVTRETTGLPDISTLATKADIGLLKSDIEQLRLATKADIAGLESWLEAKMSAARIQGVWVIIAAMALTVTLGATLPKLLG